MTEVSNEVLGAKLDAVSSRMEKIDIKVDSLGKSYVAHDIFELRLKELETSIASVKVQQAQLAKDLSNTNGRRVIVGVISAVFASIFTLLIQFYIANAQ